MGTPVWVKSDSTVPQRIGQPVRAHLLYSIFAENRLVLPAGTPVQGSVVGLEADHPHRLQARLRGDFTPFSKPIIQFDSVTLNGRTIPLPLGRAQDGAPVLQLTPPPPAKGGFIRREYDQGVVMVKDRLRLITAPGKEDRLKGLLYSQLPYHPQRIPTDTVWTADTDAPLALAPAPVAVLVSEKGAVPKPVLTLAVSTKPAEANGSQTWTLQAYLAETLSSSDAKVGGPIQAVVTQPVMGPTGEVAVPQGAVLKGEITRARPARRFGRAGELRFDFREIKFPDQPEPQDVQTNITGIDAVGDSNLSLDREGQVQPKPKDKLVVPAILFALAARPLDRDGRGDGAFGKDAVASNSLGVLGFIVGTAAGYRNLAAGIGYYGTALAVWNRWIKRGQETTLRRDTRMIVQTTARRSAPMRARP